MTNIEKINEIFIHHQGLITRQDLVDQNIPTWFLTDLVKKGHITRLSRGIYSNRFESFDTYYVFQQTHKRCESLDFKNAIADRGYGLQGL